MPTLLHLPLSPRQAAALAALLDPNLDPPTPDQVAALREVAEKLKTLREG